MCEASRQETSFETSLLVYAHSVLWIRVRELSRCQVCCAAQCGGSGHLPAEPPQPDTGGVGVHGCPHPLGASAECSLRIPDIRFVQPPLPRQGVARGTFFFSRAGRCSPSHHLEYQPLNMYPQRTSLLIAGTVWQGQLYQHCWARGCTLCPCRALHFDLCRQVQQSGKCQSRWFAWLQACSTC